MLEKGMFNLHSSHKITCSTSTKNNGKLNNLYRILPFHDLEKIIDARSNQIKARISCIYLYFKFVIVDPRYFNLYKANNYNFSLAEGRCKSKSY
jgi:hypothetical protein